MKRLALPGLPPLLACLVLVGGWEAMARILAVDGLPPPGQALRALPLVLGDREALLNIADSLRRMLIGFGLGLAVAVPVGLLMGRSRLVAASLGPLLGIVYPIPKAALMPIIMLWLGVGDASKLLVIFLGVSLPVIYHSQQGARAVEEKMLWSAAAMGMSSGRQLLRIVLPAALPEVVIGARIGLVLALITMVTSEMIARQAGIGNILFNALDMAQYETVYASILVISVLGFVLDWGCERLRRTALAWAEPAADKAGAELVVGST
jgi:NitT/TauT family transport system permease protein